MTGELDLAHRLARMFARHVAELAGLPINDSWLDDEAGRWLAVAREMLAEVERESQEPGLRVIGDRVAGGCRVVDFEIVGGPDSGRRFSVVPTHPAAAYFQPSEREDQ